MENIHKINENIYITSDEEIKEDYVFAYGVVIKVLMFEKEILYFVNGAKAKREDCKKIVLTTNQDLIKDGVQAIDNEFLEWFVKYPSCERVEVENKRFFNGFLDPEYASPKYKYKYIIIIPKEEYKQHLIDMMKADEELGLYSEPKQETALEEAILQILIENSVWEKDNVPYDTFYKVVNSMNQWLNGKNKEYISSMKLEDVKKETLEEFAKVEAMKQYSEDTFGNLVVRKSIEKGAKWQQEQQDEFAIEFAKWCAELKVWDNENYVNNTFEELLEQFKEFKNK